MRDVWTCCKPNLARNRQPESLIKSQRCLSHTAQAQSFCHRCLMLQKPRWMCRSHSHDGPADTASSEALLKGSLEAVEAAVCYDVITSHVFLSVPLPVVNANVQRASMFGRAQQSTLVPVTCTHMSPKKQVPLSRAKTQKACLHSQTPDTPVRWSHSRQHSQLTSWAARCKTWLLIH